MAAIFLVGAGGLWTAGDPVARLVDRAVAEHREYVEQPMTAPVADPQGVVRELRSEVGYAVGPVFPGDSQEDVDDRSVRNLPR